MKNEGLFFKQLRKILNDGHQILREDIIDEQVRIEFGGAYVQIFHRMISSTTVDSEILRKF